MFVPVAVKAPEAVAVASKVMSPAVLVNSIEPALEEIGLLDAIDIAPVPRSTTLLAAWIVPVGRTVDPPVIETAPNVEVRFPAPA
jgi:hypothetical protein